MTLLGTAESLPVDIHGLALETSDMVKPLDQACFFRAVSEGNVGMVSTILKNRAIDVNAYNDEGATALVLAVNHFEESRDAALVRLLIENEAMVSIKAAPPPEAEGLSIVRSSLNPSDVLPLETRKIHLSHKTPLLIALELKSSLYLKAWEYRHWDELIRILAARQMAELEPRAVEVRCPEWMVPLPVQQGWAALYASGKSEVVEVWVDAEYITVLKALLVANSHIFKLNLGSAPAAATHTLHIREASMTVVKKMMEYIYTGKVDPAFIQARGVDLFNAAHLYGVESLKHACESLIVCTPDNWIKVMTAAVNSASDVLALKCSRSVHDVLEKRVDEKRSLQKTTFALGIADDAPTQLFSRS